MRRLLGGIVVMVALTLVSGPTLTPFAAAQTKPKDSATQKDKGSKIKDTKAGGLTIEVYKDTQGEFRFRIKDGDTLLASSGKGYETKADVQKVIDNLKANLGRATMVDNSDEQPKGKGKGKDK